MTLAPRPRAPCSRGAKPKISYHFLLRLPPHPPPRSGTFERKEIFGFAAAASLLQKGLYEHFSIFASFTPAFSPSFASTRGAPVSAFCGSLRVRSHFATTSHWPLASLTMPARCCFVFALWLGGVRGNSLCLPHPPCARTSPSATRTAPYASKILIKLDFQSLYLFSLTA